MATSRTPRPRTTPDAVVTTFWKKVEGAIRKAGGNDEHIACLAKDDSNSAIKQFAEMIVNSAVGVVVNSFRDQIRAGRYDYTYGFADNPEDIEGQSFHPVTNETELCHLAVQLTTKQVYEKYGDKMASLSELLDYGIKNPDVQREFPVNIVWKVGDQFWSACLSSIDSRRELGVSRALPNVKLFDDDRILRRK